MFIIVNKNYLVPTEEAVENKEIALNKLLREVVRRTKEYSSNVYVVEYDSNGFEFQMYYFEENKLYCVNPTQNGKLKNNIPKLIYTYADIEWRNQKFIGSCKFTLENIVQNQTEDVKQIKNMNIVINEHMEKPDKFIIGDRFCTLQNESEEIKNNTNEEKNKKTTDENKQIEESTESIELNNKLNKLLEAIEEVNSMYQIELVKIRNLELSLKSYDKKILKLEKTKREETFNDVIKTQSEYRTWKKLKYKIECESDILKPIEELKLNDKESPILFLSKYEYFDKMLERDEIKKLFDELNLINLDQMYTKDELPCENILLFCKKYVKISKDLHYKFDHDWSHLDFEMNMNSTNKLFVPNK